MTDTSQSDPRIAEFVERLGALDAGERARFKRNAGNSIAESRNVIGLFYRVLPPGVPPYKERWYFLLATLYPLAEPADTGNLGRALSLARNPENRDGLDRRVEILLDADEVQFPFRLRQAIRFLYSQGVGVDWEQLLQDLLRWTHPERFIQQQWARAYFSQV